MALKETQNLPIAYGNGETLSKELERVLGHGNFELKQFRSDQWIVKLSRRLSTGEIEHIKRTVFERGH